MCNQQSKQIDKIDKLHFSEKTSSELLDFDKNLKNGKTSGAPMLLSLLSNNHKLNQRNNFLEQKIEELKNFMETAKDN